MYITHTPLLLSEMLWAYKPHNVKKPCACICIYKRKIFDDRKSSLFPDEPVAFLSTTAVIIIAKYPYNKDNGNYYPDYIISGTA
jgi:hypothetical protein